MPPRSVTRKKTRAKRSIPKMEPLDAMIDRDDTVSELQSHGQELAVTAVEEIKQEHGRSDTNSSRGEEKVAVEAKIKEELIEEENNVGCVTGNHTNVNTECAVLNGCVGRVGIDEKNDDAAMVDGHEMCGNTVRSKSGNRKNDDADIVDGDDKCRNVDEEKEEEGKQKQNGQQFSNGGTQLGDTSRKGGTAADQTNALTHGDDDILPVVNGSGNGIGGDEGVGEDEQDTRGCQEENELDHDDDDDEEHASLLINNHITDRKKGESLEIFISRLDKRAVEDDLIKVFEKFGEIKAVRVVRNSITNKSRGFAFIRYATVDQAKNALSVSKDEIKVRDKHVKISASHDNVTLYMGNICKLWAKERVLRTLQSYGVENIEEIYLPGDPQKDGKNKGFALLDFSTHSDAMSAFQRLRKPDAVFGCDRSARVSFTETPLNPSQDVLSQVKTVYVEGLTDDWTEEKLKEICKQFGETVEIKLSQNLGNTRRKDFGFVTFAARESALACVEGINNGHIGGKVKASFAKPRCKGRLQKQRYRGGFKVKKDGTFPSTIDDSEKGKVVSSKEKGHAKPKQVRKRQKVATEEQGKAASEPKIGRAGLPNEVQAVTENQHVQASSKFHRTNHKRKKLLLKAGHNEKPSKKPQGCAGRRQRNNFRKTKRHLHISKRPQRAADLMGYQNPYASRYGASAISYQGYTHNTLSGSKRPYADLEPHAGYIEPVSRKHGRISSGYLEASVAMQYQPEVGYLSSAVGAQGQPRREYRGLSVGEHVRSRTRYFQPSLGRHEQPHARYLEPAYFESASVRHNHNPYDHAMKRTGEQDIQGSGHIVYVAGSSVRPSYISNYTSYTGY